MLSEESWFDYPADAVQTVPPYLGVEQTWVRMACLLGLALAMIALLLAIRPRQNASAQAAGISTGTTAEAEAAVPAPPAFAGGTISPVFSREVQHWADRIVAWASEHGVDPNMAATIMQIESCGDPAAVSSAGAQGLFQVMPFHFTAGENTLDPDTNARRGMNYLVERLQQTGGDVGRAFAGYNGGHVAAAGSWDTWLPETQRYYTWSTGIYADARSGLVESPTLQEWLAAGGTSLCQQAAARLGLQ